MNFEIDRNRECKKPEWIISVQDKLYEDYLKGKVLEEYIGPAVKSLSVLEIDPCPMPVIDYFKEDIMFSWFSNRDASTVAIIIRNGEPMKYWIWTARKGIISNKWEVAGVNKVRNEILFVCTSVKYRWRHA